MNKSILEVRDIQKTFYDGPIVKALDHVSMSVGYNEIVGVVGESGCGKSTLARVITHLEICDAGTIFLKGEDITFYKGKKLRNCYQSIQMVFQDAVGSFDQRLTILQNISESLDNFTRLSRQEKYCQLVSLLEQVGLNGEYAKRLPGQLSGGECQRAAIARAIALQPQLLICDEATSALDVSVQAQIIELLAKLVKELKMSLLFISHDLALVSSFCDRVVVMYEGKIVEEGRTAQVIHCPRDPYTKCLLSSAFLMNCDAG